MSDFPRYVDFLEKLPLCPEEGWPRYCHHNSRVEFVFQGQVIHSVEASLLAEAHRANIEPEDLLKNVLCEFKQMLN